MVKNVKHVMENRKVKNTVVGDGFVGKTCLLLAYTKGAFPEEEYVPTVFENYAEDKVVDGIKYSLSLWDTAGQEDYERLRPLSYPNTTCFLLCFSVSARASFDNIKTKWAPEVRHHMPHTPIILVGTKADLRNADDPNLELTTPKEGEKLRRAIKAEVYLECSAQTLTGLDEIITAAVRFSTKKKKVVKTERNCLLL